MSDIKILKTSLINGELDEALLKVYTPDSLAFQKDF